MDPCGGVRIESIFRRNLLKRMQVSYYGEGNMEWPDIG